MAQYVINVDREALVPCPFDNTHMIRVCRMQYHIMKCNRNFKHVQYEACPFNARHWKPRAEMQHHVASCPDKAIIEVDLIYESKKEQSGTYFQGNCSVPEYEDQPFEGSEESWDSECDPSRGTFQWGQHDPNEYFNSSRKNEPQYSELPADWKQQLPSKATQILQANHSHQNNVPVTTNAYPDPQPATTTQRLPKTMPMTQSRTAAHQLGGHGRGRGYGTPQQVAAPTVGGSGQRVITNGIGGAESYQEPPAPVNGQVSKPGRGRGRGKTLKTIAADLLDAPSLNAANGDCFKRDNDCDSASVSSDASGSSRGKPRTVNAPSLHTFSPIQPVFSGNSSPATEQTSAVMSAKVDAQSNNNLTSVKASSRPKSHTPPACPPPVAVLSPMPVSYGLLGLGRGAPRKPLQQKQTQPKVGSSSDDDSDCKKQIRKFEKKLREIEAIEEKKDQDIELNPDEISKMKQKLGVLAQLAKLNMN